MLRKIGVRSDCVTRTDQAIGLDGFILPGVGHFDAGMRRLNETGFASLIKEQAAAGVPVLGICLGMQLLGDSSEEGDIPGLGLLPARYVRFRQEASNAPIRVPHMGWNTVTANPSKSIARDMSTDARFYFVHSYHAVVDDPTLIALTTSYGFAFPSGLQDGRIVGVQFHPEKSHDFGTRLLRNFAELGPVDA